MLKLKTEELMEKYLRQILEKDKDTMMDAFFRKWLNKVEYFESGSHVFGCANKDSDLDFFCNSRS